MKTLLTIPMRVYYEDTDAGGVMYHANYLKFFERVRSEYLFQIGLNTNSQQIDVHLAVVEVLIKYLAPARLGDMIEVNLQVKKINRSSVVFFQEIIHPLHARKICEAEITVVCISSDMKVIRIPPQLMKMLTE